MSFISDFMKLSQGSESPRSYFLWSGLCSISAVVKRNVWIERPTWKTYPNIFVFLIGESGLRKGIPINLAKDLVTNVNNTRVISGRSSLQGIISHLGTAFTTEDNTVQDKAYGFICASEFSSSIVRDQDALTHLTDLYDSCYHDKWTDLLRGGKVTLHEPSITLLGGINPAHFEDFISPTAIQGGFVARLLLIFENEKACINPAVRKIEKKTIDLTSLEKQLKEIAKVKGEILLNNEALDCYEDWYYGFENDRKTKKTKDRTGSINRVGENVLKIATLVALSRCPSLEITAEDIKESLRFCINSFSNINKTTISQGSTEYASQTKLVFDELISSDNFEMSRSKLLSRNYGTLDAIDLDRIINSLEQAKAITTYNKGPEVYYKLSKEAIEFLKRKENEN